MRKIALLFRGIRKIWRNLFYYITLCRVKWVLWDNSIIGAGSVVTKSIPSNQIWGGNPAELIRKI